MENINNNIQDDAFRGSDSDLPVAYHNSRLFVFQKTNLDFKEFYMTRLQKHYKNLPEGQDQINRD